MCHNYNLNDKNLIKDINEENTNIDIEILIKKLNELNKRVNFLESISKKNVKINMDSDFNKIIENINDSIVKLDERIIQNGMIVRNKTNKNIVLEYL